LEASPPGRARSPNTREGAGGIDKPRKEINIDAVIALAMALDRHANQPAPADDTTWLGAIPDDPG